MLKKLTPNAQSKLRSTVVISSLTQCVEQLILNSLDACANCIAVRVDLGQGKVQVVDNGCGLTKEQLENVAERYTTSKYNSLEENGLAHYGYHGESLASIRDICFVLEIESRAKSCVGTFVHRFQNGKSGTVSSLSQSRPSSGTTVTVLDLFHAVPVRKKNMNDSLELERVRYMMEAVALIHPTESLSLRNDSNGHKLLQTRKTSTVLNRFKHLFGISKARSLCSVMHRTDNCKVQGYISKDSHHSKGLQFIYVNERLVLKTKLHKFVNQLLSKSLIMKKKETKIYTAADITDSRNISPVIMPDRYGIYVLNITCPKSEYELLDDPRKTLLEFSNWDYVYKCIEKSFMDFVWKDKEKDVEKTGTDVDKELTTVEDVEMKEEGTEEITCITEEEHLSKYGEGISTNNLSSAMLSDKVKRPIHSVTSNALQESFEEKPSIELANTDNEGDNPQTVLVSDDSTNTYKEEMVMPPGQTLSHAIHHGKGANIEGQQQLKTSHKLSSDSSEDDTVPSFLTMASKKRKHSHHRRRNDNSKNNSQDLQLRSLSSLLNSSSSQGISHSKQQKHKNRRVVLSSSSEDQTESSMRKLSISAKNNKSKTRSHVKSRDTRSDRRIRSRKSKKSSGKQLLTSTTDPVLQHQSSLERFRQSMQSSGARFHERSLKKLPTMKNLHKKLFKQESAMKCSSNTVHKSKTSMLSSSEGSCSDSCDIEDIFRQVKDSLTETEVKTIQYESRHVKIRDWVIGNSKLACERSKEYYNKKNCKKYNKKYNKSCDNVEFTTSSHNSSASSDYTSINHAGHTFGVSDLKAHLGDSSPFMDLNQMKQVLNEKRRRSLLMHTPTTEEMTPIMRSPVLQTGWDVVQQTLKDRRASVNTHDTEHEKPHSIHNLSYSIRTESHAVPLHNGTPVSSGIRNDMNVQVDSRKRPRLETNDNNQIVEPAATMHSQVTNSDDEGSSVLYLFDETHNQLNTSSSHEHIEDNNKKQVSFMSPYHRQQRQCNYNVDKSKDLEIFPLSDGDPGMQHIHMHNSSMDYLNCSSPAHLVSPLVKSTGLSRKQHIRPYEQFQKPEKNFSDIRAQSSMHDEFGLIVERKRSLDSMLVTELDRSCKLARVSSRSYDERMRDDWAPYKSPKFLNGRPKDIEEAAQPLVDVLQGKAYKSMQAFLSSGATVPKHSSSVSRVPDNAIELFEEDDPILAAKRRLHARGCSVEFLQSTDGTFDPLSQDSSIVSESSSVSTHFEAKLVKSAYSKSGQGERNSTRDQMFSENHQCSPSIKSDTFSQTHKQISPLCKEVSYDCFTPKMHVILSEYDLSFIPMVDTYDQDLDGSAQQYDSSANGRGKNPCQRSAINTLRPSPEEQSIKKLSEQESQGFFDSTIGTSQGFNESILTQEFDDQRKNNGFNKSSQAFTISDTETTVKSILSPKEGNPNDKSAEELDLPIIIDDGSEVCDSLIDRADEIIDDVDDTGSTNTGHWIKTKNSVGKTIYVHSVSGNSSYSAPPAQQSPSPASITVKRKHKLLDHDSAHNTSMCNAALTPIIATDTTDLDNIVKEHLQNQDQNDHVKWKKLLTGDNTISNLLDKWKNPVLQNNADQAVTSVEAIQSSRSAGQLQQLLHPQKLTKDMLHTVKLLNQVDDKFILAVMSTDPSNDNNNSDLIVVIDQHAAHERIQLEKLTNDAYENNLTNNETTRKLRSFTISPPAEMSFTSSEVRILKRYRKEMENVGVKFKTDENSCDIIHVSSMPKCLLDKATIERKQEKHCSNLDVVEKLIREEVELLQTTHGGGLSTLPKTIHNHLCSQACHGAIKFGDPLERSVCEELLSSLYRCKLPFQCAHGRPSIIPLLDLPQLTHVTPSLKSKKPQLWKLRKSMRK